MQKFTLLLVGMFMAPLMTYAHGGDKPGPHGGNVEMPGAFHTEVVMDKDQSLHIYLLDMNFKNATTKESNVAVSFQDKKNSVNFSCSVMADHFHCIPAKKYAPKGKLVVKATREKAVGNEAVYNLPLKFNGSKKSEDSKPSHNHH